MQRAHAYASGIAFHRHSFCRFPFDMHPAILFIGEPENADTSSLTLVGYLASFRLAATFESGVDRALMRVAGGGVDLVVIDLHAIAKDDADRLIQTLYDQTVPFILTAAGADAFDRVIGLERGAEDFIDQPYHRRELVARIQLALRRAGQRGAVLPPGAERVAADVIRFDGWQLQCGSRRLTSPGGDSAALSSREYELLCALLETPRKVVSRAALAREMAGDVERSVDQLVSRLRHKFGEGPATPSPIKTVRGIGYLLDAQAVQSAAAAAER